MFFVAILSQESYSNFLLIPFDVRYVVSIFKEFV